MLRSRSPGEPPVTPASNAHNETTSPIPEKIATAMTDREAFGLVMGVETAVDARATAISLRWIIENSGPPMMATHHVIKCYRTEMLASETSEGSNSVPPLCDWDRELPHIW